MQISRLIWILILVILSTPAKSSAGEQIAGFARLVPGDTLQMRFASEGCFHAYSFDLTFTRTSVTASAEKWDAAANTYRGGEWLGALPLSETDLKDLDALLAFYRTNTVSGCTTINTIKLSQIHGGEAVATEKFTDASCRVEDGNVKGVLSIQSLLRRLQEKQK